MRCWSRLRAGCVAVLVLGGCAGGEDDPAESGAPPAVSARPEVRQDTLWIEGMAEPMTVRLYRSPDGFPIGFSTYIPEDMLTEAVSAGEGDGFRFIANFAGVRNDSAAVEVFFYREGTTEEVAREITRTIAESRGPIRGRAEVEPTDRFPWSIVEYRLAGGGIDPVAGSVALGRHEGRFFHVSIHYPVEMGDGFGPRAQLILDEWRWADTGEGLN